MQSTDHMLIPIVALFIRIIVHVYAGLVCVCIGVWWWWWSLQCASGAGLPAVAEAR